MNRITQGAKKRQAVVRCAERKSKSFASRQYGVSLSSVKRQCRQYDGKWQSLKERSHRPNSHPARHTAEEEALIRKGFNAKYYRYDRDGVYAEIQKAGYTRSLSGMIYAGKRMGLLWGEKKRKPLRTPRRNGKVERSHRNDQKYFYDREKFTSVEDLNEKLKRHLAWSNNKPMRILGDKSPLQMLKSKLRQSA